MQRIYTFRSLQLCQGASRFLPRSCCMRTPQQSNPSPAQTSWKEVSSSWPTLPKANTSIWITAPSKPYFMATRPTPRHKRDVLHKPTKYIHNWKTARNMIAHLFVCLHFTEYRAVRLQAAVNDFTHRQWRAHTQLLFEAIHP